MQQLVCQHWCASSCQYLVAATLPQVRERYLPTTIRGDLDSIRPDVLDFYRRRGVVGGRPCWALPGRHRREGWRALQPHCRLSAAMSTTRGLRSDTLQPNTDTGLQKRVELLVAASHPLR